MLMKFEFSSFMEIRPVGAEFLYAGGQTDTT